MDSYAKWLYNNFGCNKNVYPWKACIQSLVELADEVIVVDGGSTDGTWESLEEWASKEEKLKVYKVERDWSHPRFAVFDGLQKAEARKRCSGDFCWQQDADEVIHENDYGKVRDLVRNFPKQVDLVSLPVIEYWGGPGKVRLDVTPWKWRLSRNNPNITHGIPKALRKHDEDGNLYAAPGTDGCDYIDVETYEPVPHASFYTPEVEHGRRLALSGDKKVLADYENWFSQNVSILPSVHHYSWFDLERKIKLYRDYWSQHWQSLYDIEQKDTSENNMFFDSPWSEVSDDDIKALSDRLKNEMGGWIFHEKVNFDNPTPHITLSLGHPKIMGELLEKTEEN